MYRNIANKARTLCSNSRVSNNVIASTHNTCKYFHTSPAVNLKKINVTTEDKVTTIEGVIYPSKDSGKKILNLENPTNKKLCPLCPAKLKKDVSYRDVLILSQFIAPDGSILPRHVTGLCGKAHDKVHKLVELAERAGLIPEIDPSWNGDISLYKDSKSKWRKYNQYFDLDDKLKIVYIKDWKKPKKLK